MGIPILDVINVIGNVVDRVIPDPKAKAELQLELAKLADQEASRAHDEMMAQISTNTAEAGNSNMFVAGWRPAVGWICAVGAGYNFVVLPLATFVVRLCGYHGELPSTDIANLMVLLTGMLGFGGLRAYEKKQGIQDTVIAPASVQPTIAPAPKKKILGVAWPF